MSIQALNGIPIFGWLITLFLTASLAVPFWIAWTICGIGRIYFYWLPAVYQGPGFWHIVGIFIAVGTLKMLLIPSFSSSSSSSSSK